MRSFVYHIQLNVSDGNISFPFYKNLLTYFDYRVIHEDSTMLGMGSVHTDIWISQTNEGYKSNSFHRKNIGLNHISFGVDSKEAVDTFVYEFLQPNKITPLYDSPREYPEYEKGYYAVYFEDPDRIKLEVTYKPRFSKKKLA